MQREGEGGGRWGIISRLEKRTPYVAKSMTVEPRMPTIMSVTEGYAWFSPGQATFDNPRGENHLAVMNTVKLNIVLRCTR